MLKINKKLEVLVEEANKRSPSEKSKQYKKKADMERYPCQRKLRREDVIPNILMRTRQTHSLGLRSLFLHLLLEKVIVHKAAELICSYFLTHYV